ncbi:MAG: nucleotidyltransferase domain-containing protein [Bacteroidetes bacterium]|nr:nucleotidyltransferase domain-containing protein [Bacteroidota bacterium]
MIHQDHITVLREISDEFKICFGSACIAVSGSVASNTHTIDSDIDILVIESSIKQSFQLVFPYHNIKINVLCFHPGYIKSKDFYDLKKWLYSYNVIAIDYILAAVAIYDPLNMLEEFKADIRSLLEIKKISSLTLVRELLGKTNEIITFLSKNEDGITGYRNYINAVDGFVACWFLNNNLYLEEKGKYNFAFEYIKKHDSEFFNLLTNCFPIIPSKTDSLKSLRKYFEDIYESI